MKRIVPHLKLEQKVWALVEEIISTDLIVNFQGDLIRVGNQSGRRFRPGQRIQLKVTAISPLNFQLLESHSSGTAITKLDISI